MKKSKPRWLKPVPFPLSAEETTTFRRASFVAKSVVRERATTKWKMGVLAGEVVIRGSSGEF